MLRVSQRNRIIKKKNNQRPSGTNGSIFRQKSLLNRRGSECFSTGSYLLRLEDFSDNFNTFNNSIWQVVNHNLIRKYEHVCKNGDYDYFKPTDRYTRWLPQFPNDYINIDDVMELQNDVELKIGVSLPSHEKLVECLEKSTQDRQARGIPSIVAPLELDDDLDASESTENASTSGTTTATSSSTPSFTFESIPRPSTDYNFDANAYNNAEMYNVNGPSSSYYFGDYYDPQFYYMDDNVFYGSSENSVDIKPDISTYILPSDAGESYQNDNMQQQQQQSIEASSSGNEMNDWSSELVGPSESSNYFPPYYYGNFNTANTNNYNDICAGTNNNNSEVPYYGYDLSDDGPPQLEKYPYVEGYNELNSDDANIQASGNNTIDNTEPEDDRYVYKLFI